MSDDTYDLTRVRAAFALALAIRRQPNGRVYVDFRAHLYDTPATDLLLHGDPIARESIMAGLGEIKRHWSDGRVFIEVRTQDGFLVETNWISDEPKPMPVTVSAEDKAQADSVVQG